MRITKGGAIATFLVIGSFVTMSQIRPASTQPQEPHVQQVAPGSRSATQAFSIGDFAPALTVRVAYPIAIKGTQYQVGSGRFQQNNGYPTVVAVWASQPKCACSKAKSALVAAAAVKYVAPVTFIAANAIAGSDATAATEQYGFDLHLQTIAIGTEYGSSEIATRWADGIVPSVIVIDHDRRVRYIARGKDAANLITLERAIRESTAHYARERQV